jgi:hypothetical protein
MVGTISVLSRRVLIGFLIKTPEGEIKIGKGGGSRRP